MSKLLRIDMDNKKIIDNSDNVKSDEEREELSHGGGLPGGVVLDDEERKFVGSSVPTSGAVGEHADIVMSATSVGVTGDKERMRMQEEQGSNKKKKKKKVSRGRKCSSGKGRKKEVRGERKVKLVNEGGVPKDQLGMMRLDEIPKLQGDSSVHAAEWLREYQSAMQVKGMVTVQGQTMAT